MKRAWRELKPDGTPQRTEETPRRAPLRILELQRSAGNQAVARLLAGRTLQRYTQAQVSDRAAGIWEEKGAPTGQSAEQQGADWAEAEKQVGAQERETKARAEQRFTAKGVAGPQSDAEAQKDWLEAEGSIATQFRCDRAADWERLLADDTVWDAAGLPGAAATALADVKDKVKVLFERLLTGTTPPRWLALLDAEKAIDAFVAAHSGSLGRRADLLLMVKMHTLGLERRKLLIAERIEREYSIRLDSMAAVAANLASYGTGKENLDDFKAMMEPDLYSLEEMQSMETVLKRYASLLGPKRAQTLGAQPLTVFGRAKYGIDYNADADPERDPDTRGESFSASSLVAMYDAGSEASQFPTGMQQFRGTLAHELSHALLEGLQASPGKTMIAKWVQDSEMWTTENLTPYRRKTNAKTHAAVTAAGKEAPITDYGCTNAKEDMADTIKFLFEDPAKLKAECPKRYRWMRDNLDKHFDADWVKSLPTVVAAQQQPLVTH